MELVSSHESLDHKDIKQWPTKLMRGRLPDAYLVSTRPPQDTTVEPAICEIAAMAYSFPKAVPLYHFEWQS
jgi:transcriptional regulator of nitric oxide reductase